MPAITEQEVVIDVVDNTANSEFLLFAEKEDVIQKLNILVKEDTNIEILEGTYEWIQKILERYQEQASLLDPAMEQMVTIVVQKSREIIVARELEARKEQESSETGAFPFQVYNNPQLHLLFKVIYTLCRLRGRKIVTKFFTHEAADLEPVLHMLNCQDRADYNTWESRYSLLLWLSMLALVPFDICSIDSSDSEEFNSMTLVGSIISISKNYLSDSGVTRSGAAVCLASLLNRPDMEGTYLNDFLSWAADILHTRIEAGNEADFALNGNTFLIIGVLETLSLLFKAGHRTKLIEFIPLVFPNLVVLSRQASQQTLLRKLLVKLFQRIGMTYIPPRVVKWRYQRGQRSLLSNLSGSSSHNTNNNNNNNNTMDITEEQSDEEDSDDDIDLPEELEEIVEQLLCGLRDKDTVVRWSAAKGIGRITSRLPKDLADDIVENVLELFSDSETDGSWHGGCLSLAELARRGLLLPFRLPEVVPVINKALKYDVLRGSHSVGSHVRDAACYVCWAFARAYTSQVMHPYVQSLSEGMLITALYDREINCRRAASAAFQENVGRQGHANFPHGIDILTAADYFTLGNRNRAYLDISIFVAKFLQYRYALIDYLRDVKIYHWDIQVRKLTGKTLHNLSFLDPTYLATNVLPILILNVTSHDLLKRHGSMVAIAEIILALSRVPYALDPELVQDIIDIVPAVEKARLYRGRGGDIVRAAVCRLVECIALANISMTVKAQLRLMDTIDDCLKQPSEDIQLAAVGAVRQFTRTYFPVGLNGPSERLQDRIVNKYIKILETDDIASVTRGFSSALGALPPKLVSFSKLTIQAVILILGKLTDPKHCIGDEPDAETRKNALYALAEIVETVGVGGDNGLSKGQVNQVFEIYISSTNDYSTDKRGDVGSWSRLAAMKGLEKLIYLSVRASTVIPQKYTMDIGPNDTIPINTVVDTDYGKGTVSAVKSDGFLYEIKYNKPALGFFYFGFNGIGILRRTSIQPITQSNVNNQTVIVPTYENRKAFLEKNVNDNILASVRTQTPMDCIKNKESELYFEPQMCRRLIEVLLKQLCEKLDGVRGIAGDILLRILYSEKPEIPFIPQVEDLKKAFYLPEDQTRNFCRAVQTFPMMVCCMNLQPYHKMVVSGLIQSIGGLTEAVVKNSTNAILQWTKACYQYKRFGSLSQLAMTLLDLFDENLNNDRVIVPLIKTLNTFFQNNVFQYLYDDQNNEEFSLGLLARLKKELAGCGDVKKLISAVNVLCDLIHFPKATRQGTLQMLMIFLGHRYPRVRCHTAEQLYIKFLEEEDAIKEKISEQSYDSAIDLLLETMWDSEDSATARAERNKVSTLLSLKVPASKTRIIDPAKENQKKKDELESYASLVKDAGY